MSLLSLPPLSMLPIQASHSLKFSIIKNGETKLFLIFLLIQGTVSPDGTQTPLWACCSNVC